MVSLAVQQTLTGLAQIRFRRRKSRFIRFFRESCTEIVCPGFWLLAWANGCTYHCDYCFLQGTFRGRTDPVVFTNLGDLLRELKSWFGKFSGQAVLNAGELSDSLAITDKVMKFLIRVFGEQNRLLLVTNPAT